MNKTLILLFLVLIVDITARNQKSELHTKLLLHAGIQAAAALLIFVKHVHTKLDVISVSVGGNGFVPTDLLNVFRRNIFAMNNLTK